MLDEIKILLGLSDDSRNELLETIMSITKSISFSDNDFDSYLDDIQSWLNSQDEPSTKRGRIRFL